MVGVPIFSTKRAHLKLSTTLARSVSRPRDYDLSLVGIDL